uniref:DNA topoisomerase n=1 Tax=Setaria digitata TaxID=48799 RepID=A0A915PLF3_9BILA
MGHEGISDESVPLCTLCTRQLKEPGKSGNVKEPYNCALCFGVLDGKFVDEVIAEAKKIYESSGYDSKTFLLAINMPVTAILRETLYELAYQMPSSKGTLSMVPFKLRIVNAYLERIRSATGLSPSLHSDLILTLTFVNDEFNKSDVDYLMKEFPTDFQVSRKRLRYASVDDTLLSMYTKVRIANLAHKLNREYALNYKMTSPSASCHYTVSFERSPLFIAGRYCKFSRNLSQSPWSSSSDIAGIIRHSVSEKVGAPFIKETGCDVARFVASGREDIDVRMLGSGRPFVLQLINPKRILSFRRDSLEATLKHLEECINKDPDVKVLPGLKQITSVQASLIKNGQDGKRFQQFVNIENKAPIEVIQKTPVRVLKRRPLLERRRMIFSLAALKLDDYHFLVRMETQAGTYVKEFVHGDFGRTRPSLADLLGVECGEIDILELDVEGVDMEWPPKQHLHIDWECGGGGKGGGSMASVSVLMVAEKPMLAESIAKILSNGKAEKRKGWNNVCSVSEYYGEFQRKSARFKVTSTCGHVMCLDFPSKMNNWEKVDPIQLFSSPTTKKEANPKMRMNEYLASEARGCDFLVLWLDCDKEGENICFEVIEAVKNSMIKPRTGDIMRNVYRAHFSAITAKDIKSAMQDLGRPNINESLSVDARQELDLRIGCAFTRFQTRYFQGKYGDLDSTTISFGPCQTPTLGFCVTRHDLITQFRPEPYWVLETVFETSVGEKLKPAHARGHIFDKDVCQLFFDRVKKQKEGVIVDVSSSEFRKERPQALNTVELLRISSSGLGLSPSQTMSAAEYLYTRGFISYPRTETTAYPSNFDFFDALKHQQNDGRWKDIVKKLLSEGITKPRGGEDKGDHPPISPLRGDDGSLTGDALKVYQYVTQHFIATLMKPCAYFVTTVKIDVANEIFIAKRKRLIDPGYTEIMTWQKIDEDTQSFDPVKGTKLILNDGKVSEYATVPPDYLTESELISLMEKHGIGTDASIPVHISNICQRNYVTVESKRRLKPTKLGIALVHGYWKIDSELVLPTMRSEVESQLNLIAKGYANFHSVKDHVLENFRLKFIYFVENIGLVDSLFEDSFTSLAASGKPFSRCGKCRRFMKLVASKPQRLHCPNCQDTYSVPFAKDGLLRLHGENKCPLDDFDLIYWQGPGGKLSMSYALCPYCYNNPPFEGMKKGSGCHECSNPACPHSFLTLGVVQCPRQCDGGRGILVLDPQSAPKWRISCNRCSAVVAVFEGALRVKVLTKQCANCGAQLFLAEYKDKSPLPEERTTYRGCIFCDKSISHLVNLNHAYNADLPVQRRSNNVRQKRGGGGASVRGRGRIASKK